MDCEVLTSIFVRSPQIDFRVSKLLPRKKMRFTVVKARSKKMAVNTPSLVSAVRPLMQAFVAQKIKAGVWTAPRGVAGRGNT